MANFSFLARLRMFMALVVTFLLVSACGGGGTTLAGVGSGGTGFAVNSGFGSLILDGVHHNDSTASYWSEQEQGTAMAMARTGATVGQSTEFTYDASRNIMSALVSPELVGAVTAVGANSLAVLGTNVFINSDATLGPVTRFVGYASLASIKVTDRVEVHGQLKTDSLGVVSLQATLIVQQPAATGLRLTGYVAQYNASAGTFLIGANSVKAGSAVISPAGAALANGALVTVWSTTDPVGNSITASTIRIKGLAGTSQNVTASGTISNFASAASFKLRNLTVDASKAAITPSAATLGAGKYVVVLGSYDASANKVNATSVTVFTSTAPTKVELHGTVANFVSASSFTVRGVALNASAATFAGGTAAQLANGVYVEVHGAIEDDVVRASSVVIQALSPLQAPADAVIDVSGTIAAYNAATGSYTMTMPSGANLNGSIESSMFYSNGTAANLVVGQAVNVHGTFHGGMLSTSVVNFSPMSVAPPLGKVHMEGIAYNVTPTSMMLNGVLIQISGVQIQSGGMAGGSSMVSGSAVAVDMRLTGGQYVATAIALMHPH
ncbi:MAG: hypothetical protein D4R79_09495 [Comamonadaceae bacterium]|nr:MAG: hypothetical protein D4R79_09495 [Comamonadaceae bacterium]